MSFERTDREVYVRLAVESESNGVSDFLEKYFSTGCPMKVAYLHKQIDQEGRMNYGERSGFVLKAINNENILVAIERSTNTLVGVLVADTLDSKSNGHLIPITAASSSGNENWADILKFLAYIKAKSNVCERFVVDQCFHIEMVGVHQEYRKQNIATQLFEGGIALAKSRNHKLVSVDGVNIYSSKIAEKLGMEVVTIVSYDEYNDHLGKCLFVPGPPNMEIKTLVKKL